MYLFPRAVVFKTTLKLPNTLPRNSSQSSVALVLEELQVDRMPQEVFKLWFLVIFMHLCRLRFNSHFLLNTEKKHGGC